MMARPDSVGIFSPKPPPAQFTRRVSHLVGRFEQLGTSAPSIEHDSVSITSASSEPSPACGAKVGRPEIARGRKLRNVNPSARRAVSMASPGMRSGARLASEMRLHDESFAQYDILRKRTRGDGDSIEGPMRDVAQSEVVRQDYEEQRRGLEGETVCMQPELSSQTGNEGLVYDRAALEAEVAELRQQLSLSKQARQTDLEGAKVEIQRQKQASGARLRDADAKMDAAYREAKAFEQQLLELKRNMSTSTRVEKQVADAEIIEDMGRLNNEIQNWIVSTYRKVKIDSPAEMKRRFDDLPIPIESNLLRSAYDDFDPASKMLTLQSTVIYLMMRVFEDDYFFGLPEGLKSLHQSVKILKSPTAPYNEWRSQTFQFLQKVEGDVKDAIDAATGKRIGKLIHDIISVLSLLTKTELTEHQRTSLGKIVEHAISLSKLFGLQRAVYTCVLPDSHGPAGLSLDERIMEDVSDTESDGSHMIIRCVTFPAVLKAGDEHGDDMRLETVVIKAKVLCHADEYDESHDEYD